jgi:hypothetical protein
MQVKRVMDHGVDRDMNNKARVTRKYRVVADSVNQTELDILSHPSIPNIGAVYELSLSTLGNLFCIRQHAERLSPLLWEVVVEYDTHAPPPLPPPGTITDRIPLLQPPRITWGGSHYLHNRRRDVEGKEYLDAAGTPLRDVPPHELPLLICLYERNEPFYDAHAFFDYVKTVNMTGFGAFLPWHCKMENITGTPDTWQGETYYKVLYEIHIRRDEWIPVDILNQGYFALKDHYVEGEGFNTKRAAVVDELGNRAAYPMPLTEDGYQLKRIDPATGELNRVNYLLFKPLAEEDWGPLGLT